jgi:hypothetical protein
MLLATLDPTSTRQDWDFIFQFVDDHTDEPLDLTGASVLVELRDRLGGQTVVSVSTTGGGISIIDTGTIEILVPAATMRALRADMYEIGGTYTLNGATRQFVIGLLPVLDGIVT